MKVSQLINKLQKIQDKYGDIEVKNKYYYNQVKYDDDVSAANFDVAQKKTDPIVVIKF